MSTLFVANRGEIALRVIRTARVLGHRTAVMHVPEESAAPYVAAADDAVEVPALTQAKTSPFLDIGLTVKTASDLGAELIHPGYGFLSEEPDFAEAVIEAGMTWVGPPPAAIRKLADKVSARTLASTVGAPLAPGSSDPVQDAQDVLSFAKEHGYPVVIKASHGGGGRGMRVIQSPDEAEQALESARSEARTSFGNDECFVEKFLEMPRHVETQCLADQHGNITVVGTRDCSVQRRHQKLVEEAPAPGLSDEQLGVLTTASKDIMSEAGYQGAGTCEFLIARDGTISFLEVNTRLQVEHPVTEETTGLDLVEQQLRIAAGDVLDIPDHLGGGAAIEFRINGEDPGMSFFPSVGTVTEFEPPNGPWVRVDSGVRRGNEVTPQFDSMIAKLIVSGTDREQVIARSRQALQEFEVQGITTVLPLHLKLLDASAFVQHGQPRAEGVYTKWLEEEFIPTAVFPDSADPVADAPVMPAGEGLKDVTVILDGHPSTISVPDELLALLKPQRATAPRVPGLNSSAGGTGSSQTAEEPDGTVLRAPAQAVVTQVCVEEGARVTAEEQLVVLEVMKMEHSVRAPHDGLISTIACGLGETVTRNAPLISLQ